MKRVISILMILAILGTVFSVLAAGLTSGSFTYTVSGFNATITDWSGSGSVTVPATITNGSTTYKVTKIGSYAFADKSLTSVSFSGTNLTEIGEGAFSTNPGLTRITIPVNVTTIKARAFHSCVNLQSLSFANNCKLTTIGQYAFRNCQSLMNFTFPSGLTTIEKYAFSYCTYLSKVVFPESVTSVGEEAFIGCLNLNKAIFYNTGTSIGDNAFDLTYATRTQRFLEISSYTNNSTAKAFANSEHFTYTVLPEPVELQEDTIPTPSAGSYKYRVYIQTPDAYEMEHSATTITVTYKANNGTGTNGTTTFSLTKNQLNDDKASWYFPSANGSTISGFPTTVGLSALKSNNSVWNAHIHVELQVYNNNTSTWVWVGGNASGNSSDYQNISAGKNMSNVTANSGKYPTVSDISAITYTGGNMSVDTDGQTIQSEHRFVPGTVYDQYGVSMNKTVTLTFTTNSGSTSGISITDHRVQLTSEANRANNYTITVKQTVDSFTSNNTKAITVKTFDYIVTYSYFDGNTPKSLTRTVNYGNTATAPMSNANMPSKYENADGHYPFSSWDTSPSTTYTSGPQIVQVNAQYGSLTEHSYTEEVTAPTCFEYGNTHNTCDCGFIIYDSYTAPTHHNNFTNPAEYTTEAIPPSDGHAGATVYKCTLCNKGYCTKKIENGVAVPDTETGYFTNTEDLRDAVDELPQKAEVPAPAFNNFAVTYESGSVIGEFPYQSRLSQLKVEHQNATYVDKNTTQALRFAGAVTVPEGVSTAVGSTTINDNVVTDFGFVYTQNRFITGPNKLVIGGKTDDTSVNGKTYDIAKYSVKDANTGVYNGSNWSGVTLRNMNGKNTLTFNLLIAVYAKNWNRAYAARPYLTYRYNGVEYTIYDQGTTLGTNGRTYSCASVAYIATIAANNIFEPESTRTYLQNKVVNHLSEQGGYVANPTV